MDLAQDIADVCPEFLFKLQTLALKLFICSYLLRDAVFLMHQPLFHLFLTRLHSLAKCSDISQALTDERSGEIVGTVTFAGTVIL
ncbi:hypothetical protein [Kosakonia quasisacchari]|uniref:hypothetical protein n=1 Tax=Kosakonia quasisacchari TaxID=2529380 RepID=UPI0039E15E9A